MCVLWKGIQIFIQFKFEKLLGMLTVTNLHCSRIYFTTLSDSDNSVFIWDSCNKLFLHYLTLPPNFILLSYVITPHRNPLPLRLITFLPLFVRRERSMYVLGASHSFSATLSITTPWLQYYSNTTGSRGKNVRKFITVQSPPPRHL
jgi:WD40 repeat protein